VNLLALDNAVLKLKHNGLLTVILTCAASSDLNPVDYASGDGLITTAAASTGRLKTREWKTWHQMTGVESDSDI